MIVAGMVLAAWARVLFKRKGIPVRPGEDMTELETSGPYGFTRNPMYLGMTSILLGESFLLGSLAAFAGPLAFWAVINFMFIPFEEGRLEDTFGQEYLEYKRRVRRWV